MVELKYKRILIGVLITYIILSITGCGKNKVVEEYDYYKYGYDETETVISEIKGQIRGSSYYSDRYFVIAEDSGDLLLYSFGSDLKDILCKPLKMEDRGNILSVSVKAYITMLVQMESGGISLVRLDYEGNVLKSVEIDGMTGVNDYDVFVISANDGSVGVIADGKIMLFDEDMKKIDTLKDENGYIAGAVFDDSGNIICCVRDNQSEISGSSVYMAEVDETGMNRWESSVYDIRGVYGRMIPESDSGKIYVRLYDGIYFFNDHKELEKKLDYFDSMLLSSDTENFLINEDQEFAEFESDENENRLKVYTHVNNNFKSGRTVLEYGSFFSDDAVSEMIIDFNKNSEDYYIRVKDYGLEEGLTRFNLDMIAGEGPDMFDLRGYYMIESYIKKGLVENLNSYIEKDSEISKNLFLDTYYDACCMDGCIYYVSDSFKIDTLVTRKNPYITEYSCTADELEEYVKNSSGADFFPWKITRMDLYGMLFQPYIIECVDYQNCKFNVDEDIFPKTAELCYDMGEEELNEGDTFPDFDDMVQAYEEGKALFWSEVTPSEIYFINHIFDNEVCYSGYPEGGSYFYPGECVCMSSKSDHKDACWEFMRKFMMYDHQKKIALDDGDVIPSRKDCFELQCERMSTVTEYVDDEGNIMKPLSEQLYVNNEIIESNPLTKRDIDHMKELINHTHKCAKMDEKVLSIAEDELKSYFDSEHDIEIVKKIIKNRIETYLNETL